MKIIKEVEVSEASFELAKIIAQILQAYIYRLKKMDYPGVPGEFVNEIIGDVIGEKHFNLLSEDPIADADLINRLWIIRLDGIKRGLECYAKAEHPNFEEIGSNAFREFGRWAVHLDV